ncbi:hypothetical protein F8S09_09130 [Deinococcus sp. SDU3-2]|uniref:Uncharacterized protein n=1 Tax=Deinococcus terrestris TaxID=2651870 RepID=A0A7X1TRX2_9DEIO|nr:hypothetical protein [Deinococcus terrestris]MPY66849.1 hypothetical protein [Deinococcus terrestris]
MPQTFNEAVQSSAPGENSALRALQAWQYLIGKAANRQLVQYEELRLLMDFPTPTPLTHPLGNLMFYCQQNALPPLTILVVNRSGIPGGGFSAAPLEEYHQRREEVFNYPWFKLVPPTVQALKQARERAGGKEVEQ